jgi:hypothetical protein
MFILMVQFTLLVLVILSPDVDVNKSTVFEQLTELIFETEALFSTLDVVGFDATVPEIELEILFLFSIESSTYDSATVGDFHPL